MSSQPTWSDPEFVEWYIAHLAGGSPVHHTAIEMMLSLLPDVSGFSVLDLGCGEGLASRQLASRRAKVVGLDLSARLVEEARRLEHAAPLGIDYRVGDAQQLDEFGDGSFDIVTANLTIPNIEHLERAFQSVRRVLVGGGSFSFTVPHPCFETPFARWTTDEEGQPARVVNHYFREEFWRSPEQWRVRRVGNYHRTLTTYFDALHDAGLQVRRVIESPADSAINRIHSGYSQVPLLLAIHATR